MGQCPSWAVFLRLSLSPRPGHRDAVIFSPLPGNHHFLSSFCFRRSPRPPPPRGELIPHRPFLFPFCHQCMRTRESFALSSAPFLPPPPPPPPLLFAAETLRPRALRGDRGTHPSASLDFPVVTTHLFAVPFSVTANRRMRTPLGVLVSLYTYGFF